jgi:rubrerythrin
MASKLIGASVWEEELYEHLLSHGALEGGALEAYQRAADKSESAAFRYLVSLIMEDERRHHKLFADLADALRVDAEVRPTEPKIPRLGRWDDQQGQILELTDRLLDLERGDAKELKRLAHELDDVKDTTLWSLLVELMEADTAKHIRILEFIKKQARRHGP